MMPWSERAQKALCWKDAAGKRLAELGPDHEGIPYREWLLLPSYRAAEVRRHGIGHNPTLPEAPRRGNQPKKRIYESFLGHEKMNGF